jgi:hypothetical protein
LIRGLKLDPQPETFGGLEGISRKAISRKAISRVKSISRKAISR